MNQVTDPEMTRPLRKQQAISIGFYIAIAVSVLTIIAFAVVKTPISGPFCPENCIDYPYTDILSRFPGDYLWMYPAALLMLLIPILMASVHYYAPIEKRIFSLAGFGLVLISATILFLDYFVQVSVIQPSLVLGETDGIPLLTQYNPHGLFIAMEDAGYLTLSVALFCAAPVFAGRGKPENAIRWIWIANFIITIGALILISVVFGIFREYYFEVVALSSCWLSLIITGILLSIVFRREMKALES